MSLRPLVPQGDALRHAIAWLAQQETWNPQLIEEACRRFDLTPLDEEFLLAEYRRLHAQGVR
jgi:hypothetical protein